MRSHAAYGALLVPALERTWEALQEFDLESGQNYYCVLRLRAGQPALQSPRMAERLSSELDREVNAGWVRKRLHFAREKFTELLLKEIEQPWRMPRRINCKKSC